ncbi:MAG: HlyD family efflux transporter periplasmic adaptor subunit [Acidobacteria bacterium]|nr:HlyD family efflux transporter periplasmic adaptor subunit [Acidobacteriota bacterium]
MKKRLLALVAVVVVGAAAVFYARWQPTPPVDRLVVSGNIEVTEARASFKTGGRVEARLVSEGAVVQAGQTVARLDRVELAQQVALQQAEVHGAAADLAELEAGSRPEEISQGEAALARARAEEERWRAEAARQAALYEQDIVSAREREAAQAALEVARALVRDAEERLTLLRKGPRHERIAQARARLERARQALGLSQTRLDDAMLVAPISGIVLSEHVEPGEYVSPGTPVVTIGALADVWLRAYIDQPDLGRVKVGQRARLTTDTYPDKVYDGVVSFLASEAEFTPKNVQTQKERVKLVYRIKVDVPNPSFELKPGMPADAEILLAEAPRASR